MGRSIRERNGALHSFTIDWEHKAVQIAEGDVRLAGQLTPNTDFVKQSQPIHTFDNGTQAKSVFSTVNRLLG
jgi:hypothetical protein